MNDGSENASIPEWHQIKQPQRPSDRRHSDNGGQYDNDPENDGWFFVVAHAEIVSGVTR
jgi:hypothetical protein